MSVILNLPPDLFVLVFSEWLPLEELGKFDSALVQSKIRPYFLQMLTTLPAVNTLEVRNIVYTPACPLLYEWIIRRRISLNDLYLSDRSFDKSYNFNFKGNCSTLKQLRIECDNNKLSAKIKQIAASCIAIESLFVDDADMIELMNLANVHTLKINEYYFKRKPDVYVDQILVSCRNLVSLTLQFQAQIPYTENICLIIAANPKLRFITVPATGQILQYIVQYCSDVEVVVWTEREPYYFSEIKELVTEFSSTISKVCCYRLFKYDVEECGQKYLSLDNIDTSSEFYALCSSLSGMKDIEIIETLLSDECMSHIVTPSASTLECFVCDTSISLPSLGLLLKSCPMLSTLDLCLESSRDVSHVFDDCSLVLEDLRLHSTIFTMSDVIEIIKMCPKLENCQISDVIESDTIFEFKKLMKTIYQERPKFTCDIIFECYETDVDLRLKFIDGKYRISGLDQYFAMDELQYGQKVQWVLKNKVTSKLARQCEINRCFCFL